MYTVSLDSVTVNKSSGKSSNTEDGDFYGMNAAVLATNGANVTIKNSEINSSAQNGNGVFSYGSGTTVNISDTKIVTTADITVKNAELTANNSEALVIEGKNSITLENCDVTGNMSDSHGASSDENVHNIMIYQSMSGYADVGTSSFSATGGSKTSQNGDVFYITNTHCVINLSKVNIINNGGGYLMRVVGNSANHGWGSAGSNGGQTEFTANEQTLEGDIVVDDISTLNFKLIGNSTFTGTLNIAKNEHNGTAVSDNITVMIEEGSVWSLTGDCTVTSLENNGKIEFNGYTITLADGTVLKE